MALFDSIRYPISIPIRQEELEALPEALYNKWVCESLGPGITATPRVFIMVADSTDMIYQALNGYDPNTNSIRGHGAAAALRKMILEWDGE